MRTLLKLLHYHVIYKDVFREIGLIEVMVTCLQRYAALLKDVDTGSGTAYIINIDDFFYWCCFFCLAFLPIFPQLFQVRPATEGLILLNIVVCVVCLMKKYNY